MLFDSHYLVICDRKHFENFDPSSIAQFTEKKLITPKINGNPLLSEPKLRAIVENAKQLLKVTSKLMLCFKNMIKFLYELRFEERKKKSFLKKNTWSVNIKCIPKSHGHSFILLQVQQEFGSFSNYCWRFVNHKPIRNEFRYGRQVPVKTPKAELISKDMMRRGFQCVGPTVVYSFMQVAGLVNDHLLTCFRYQECNVTTKNEFKTEVKEKMVQTETLKLTQIQ